MNYIVFKCRSTQQTADEIRNENEKLHQDVGDRQHEKKKKEEKSQIDTYTSILYSYYYIMLPLA